MISRLPFWTVAQLKTITESPKVPTASVCNVAALALSTFFFFFFLAVVSLVPFALIEPINAHYMYMWNYFCVTFIISQFCVYCNNAILFRRRLGSLNVNEWNTECILLFFFNFICEFEWLLSTVLRLRWILCGLKMYFLTSFLSPVCDDQEVHLWVRSLLYF